MKLVIRPEARRDVLRQVGYLLEELAYDAAERFPGAVKEALKFIVNHPKAGSPRPLAKRGMKGLRSWPIPGFEEVRVYYVQPRTNVVRVLRIIHGKRDLNRTL
ncbi:MAG: type II toxin-antitoxin system RelE/ParE family toxin [Bryobacteraceae bacterium]